MKYSELNTQINDDINKTIERLYLSIQKANLSYGELSQMTGIAKSALHRYATGQTKKIPLDAVKKIAEATGVSATYIMGGSDDPNVDSPKKTLPNMLHNSQLPDNIIPLPKMKKIPLIGTIACGEPILAAENIDCEISIPENINADFALRCKGDSMIDARILDGDIVYIHQQPTVNNGEIAAVLIGEEATLKRVYFDNTTLTLVACNQSYQPFVYTGEQLNEIRILGKAVSFLSKVK